MKTKRNTKRGLELPELLHKLAKIQTRLVELYEREQITLEALPVKARKSAIACQTREKLITLDSATGLLQNTIAALYQPTRSNHD